MTGTIDASFEELMKYLHDYVQESLKSDYLEETLAKYDTFSFLEQYNVGLDLGLNDGDPAASNVYALDLLEALRPKLLAQFKVMVSDHTIPPPPNLDSHWDPLDRKWLPNR